MIATNTEIDGSILDMVCSFRHRDAVEYESQGKCGLTSQRRIRGDASVVDAESVVNLIQL